MKKIFLFILLIIFSIPLQTQNTKGVSVSNSSKTENTGKTCALIVGISKYQNPAIPQLQFAERDAKAFRDYLLQTEVDSDNITLLLNEQATSGEFWAAIFYY